MLRASSALALAALACASAPARPWPPFPAGLGEEAARETVQRFASALEAGRFEEAQALLSARWRAAYDARRLALDFSGNAPARSMAREVLARLAVGQAPVRASGGRATVRLEGAGEAVVVAEGGSWRVETLN